MAENFESLLESSNFDFLNGEDIVKFDVSKFEEVKKAIGEDIVKFDVSKFEEVKKAIFAKQESSSVIQLCNKALDNCIIIFSQIPEYYLFYTDLIKNICRNTQIEDSELKKAILICVQAFSHFASFSYDEALSEYTESINQLFIELKLTAEKILIIESKKVDNSVERSQIIEICNNITSIFAELKKNNSTSKSKPWVFF